MAFNFKLMNPIAGQIGASNEWKYGKHPTDTLADMGVVGYFDDAVGFGLQTGDTITCVASDGTREATLTVNPSTQIVSLVFYTGDGDGDITGSLNAPKIPYADSDKNLTDSIMSQGTEIIDVDGSLSITDGDGRSIEVPSTATYPATPSEGMIIYYTGVSPAQLQSYINGAWVDIAGAEAVPYLRTFEYWVSEDKGSDPPGDGNGSRTNPFKTIQYVIDTYGAAVGRKIIYIDYESTEDLILTNAIDVTICGSETELQAKLTGSHFIGGTPTGYVQFRNLELTNIANEYIIRTNAVAINSGSLIFNNVTVGSTFFKFINSEGHSGLLHIQIKDSNTTGRIVLQATVNGSFLQLINSGITLQFLGDSTLEMNDLSIVEISNCQSIAQVLHTQGRLRINGLSRFSDGISEGIVSTAVLSPPNSMELKNVAMINISGDWVLIDKTGDCDFVLDSVSRDEANDSLNGTQLLNENAVDIKGNHDPTVNYTPTNASIEGHLAGIDTALAGGGTVGPVTENTIAKGDDGTNVIKDSRITDDGVEENPVLIKGSLEIVALTDDARYLHLPNITEAAKLSFTPSNGMLVYNKTNDTLESYIDSDWVTLGEGGGGASAEIEIEELTISADGQTAFTLTAQPANNKAVLLSLNGSESTRGVDYSISGKNLTWDNVGLPLKTTDDLVARIFVSIAVPTVKSFFISCEMTQDYQISRRANKVAGGNGYNFNFYVPLDFTTITDVNLIGFCSAGAAGVGRTIDLTSEYTDGDGELYNQYTETPLTQVYDFTGKTNRRIKIDLIPALSNIVPGSEGGVYVKHVIVGGDIFYTGIEIIGT